MREGWRKCSWDIADSQDRVGGVLADDLRIDRIGRVTGRKADRGASSIENPNANTSSSSQAVPKLGLPTASNRSRSHPHSISLADG